MPKPQKPEPPEAKKRRVRRMSFDVPQNIADQLEALAVDEVTTMVEILKKGVKLYALVKETENAGGKVLRQMPGENLNRPERIIIL
jgi:hypothetical protein